MNVRLLVCLSVLLSFSRVEILVAQEIADFSRAEIVSESTEPLNDYRLLLSSLKKINGQWRAETERRVAGSLQRTTLQVTGGHSVDEAYNFYVQQLQGPLAAREIFRCEGLKCGPSSAWANEHFQLKELYGLDKFQYYSVWLLGPGKYLSLYGIRRGNKRVYIHHETMSADNPQAVEIATTPESIARALNTEGFYGLPSEVLKQSESELSANVHIQSVVKALLGERLIKLTVVGHDHKTGSAAQKLSRSAELAERIQRVLIASGVAEKRLSVFALGAYAPQGRGDEEVRVLLVRD